MGQKAWNRTENSDWELQVIPGTYYIDFDREDEYRRTKNRRKKRPAGRGRKRKSHRIGRILIGAGALYLLAVILPAAGRTLLNGRSEAEQFLNHLEAAGHTPPNPLQCMGYPLSTPPVWSKGQSLSTASPH